jgi:uncharacterized protein
MSAIGSLFARTAPALLVLLLSTQGTFSQAADPQKSTLQSSPATDPAAKKLPGKTAHRPADRQKSAPPSSPAAVVTGKIPEKAGHRLIPQVASNEPSTMNLVLNNAANVAEHYRASREKVEIEIMVYGPGLHMLRDDTSPVKSRIASLSKSSPNVSFMAATTRSKTCKSRKAGRFHLFQRRRSLSRVSCA